AYARRFGVLECIRFGSKVLGAEYAGVPEEQIVAAWERWAGNGEAFGDGTGEWLLTVQHRGSEHTQMYRFDFLILCIGMFGGVANTPTFPPNRGPEVFHGQVLHSKDYSDMDAAAAAELIRGKRVAVVGSGKSAFDTAAECADANGARFPCTMICRNPRWMVNGGFVWGVSIGQLFMSRLAELMVARKPGEGLALCLLAMLLSPLRWLTSKLAEAYFKMHIPMREHGMVPDRSFSWTISACRLGVLTDRFYDRVAEGSVVIKRARSVSFCADGLVLDEHDAGERRVEADVVVLATGFRGADKLRGIFVSPTFKEMVAGGPDNPAPLYRQCVHPRIPQMAVIGYSDSSSSIYHYEMMAKWVAHLLDGAFRLPGVGRMERSVAEWGEYVKRHGAVDGEGPCISAVNTWYNDELCRDMGYDPRRKKGILAEWMQPYGPADYAGIR
ncbi:putative flavin-containing monooxygenase 1, partial [Dichanthelium oligosanthes]